MLTPVSPRERNGRVEWRCGLRVRHDGDTAVVVDPHGELDVATAPRLNLTLTELRADGVRQVTVDLAHVTFLDTAGLRVLLECDRLLRARGGALTLVNASARIVRLLHVTRTAHLLGHDGVDAAAPVRPVGATVAA